MIQSIIYRKLSSKEATTTSYPGTAAESHNLGSLAIQQDAKMSDTEEVASGTIRWSNLKSKKRKDPSATPDQSALVASSEVVCPRGVLDLSCLPKQKEPKYNSAVHVTLTVPLGTVKDFVMDLLFMGLETIRSEDK
jgi:hypothetical protein